MSRLHLELGTFYTQCVFVFVREWLISLLSLRGVENSEEVDDIPGQEVPT